MILLCPVQGPWASSYFSCRSVNKNSSPDLFLKKVAHRTQMHDMWPFGPLVYLMTLTLKFDLLLKNFNLGCYLVMVAAWRGSLSSDNSYSGIPIDTQ